MSDEGTEETEDLKPPELGGVIEWKDGEETEWEDGEVIGWKPGEMIESKAGEMIERKGGVQLQVTSVKSGSMGWRYKASAKPLAAEKGYLTLNQALGYKIQHMPPPSPPKGGTLRDPGTLKAVDWDFNAVMKEPLEVRKLALVHELARECGAMREACRVYHEGKAEADEWKEKATAAKDVLCVAEDEVKRLEDALVATAKRGIAEEINAAKQTVEAAREKARLASCGHSFVVVSSGNGAARQEWEQAAAFISAFLKRLPFEARGLLPGWIAEDLPWVRVDAEDRKGLLEEVTKKEKAGEDEAVRKSRTHKDMEADGPGWPFNCPIEFARKWDKETGLPKFSFNDGRPGRMILAEPHEDAHRLPILSEALSLSVCLNFSDEEILESFGKWLNWRRANLHDDLKAFRAAGGSALRMKGDRVNKGLKALGALRLRAKFDELEAADRFRVVYPAERAWTGKGNLAPMSQVWDLAKDAEEIGLEFLPECRLDSSVKRNH